MPAGKPNVQAMKLVLTCEHAFPDIPEKYQKLFNVDPDVLKTHEAFDPGAFDLFGSLKKIADFSYYQEIGRLLVESNRSLNHQKIFSRFALHLSENEKKEILETYYFPYRRKIENRIHKFLERGSEVVHLSIHSFTPVLYDKTRNADIGILYDPAKEREKEIASLLKSQILENYPDLKVRFNYPYLGKSDGFTTSLRKMYATGYSGIELEINQKWVHGEEMDKKIKNPVLKAVTELKNVR